MLHQSNINALKIAHWHNGRVSKKEKMWSKRMSKQYEEKGRKTPNPLQTVWDSAKKDMDTILQNSNIHIYNPFNPV